MTKCAMISVIGFILNYLLDAVGSSGILKGKQKLGVTFNSDKQGGISRKDLKKYKFQIIYFVLHILTFSDLKITNH